MIRAAQSRWPIAKVKLRCGRAAGDPEKAIVPALVWCAMAINGTAARSISVGWWDFHVSLTLITSAPRGTKER